MTDNKLTTCTLQQACNWILFAKQPEHPFETDINTEAYDEKKYAKALLNAKKILLRGFYDDIVHPIGIRKEDCGWKKQEPIPGLVGCKYIELNLEQNTIFFTESPEPFTGPQLYVFVEISVDELQKLIPDGKSLLDPIYKTPTTYVFPKNVLISEYMSVVLDILSEGKINTDSDDLTAVNVIRDWIRNRYKQKYPNKKQISKHLASSLATALRPVSATEGRQTYKARLKEEKKK